MISMYIISVQPSKYRFVVLDAYDVSLLGREESSLKYQQAIAILKAHNDNEDLNHPPGRYTVSKEVWTFSTGSALALLTAG